MPAMRRTTRHVEAVEDHGTQIQVFVLALEEIAADGRICPGEEQLLDAHVSRLLASYRPLPAEAAVIDSGIGLVSTLLDTLSVTAWVERRAREAAADEQGLVGQGLLEPVAA